MLRWLRRTAPQPGEDRSGPTQEHALLDWVATQITSRERARSVDEAIERWKKQKTKARQDLLADVFLLAEQYLVEVQRGHPNDREELRQEVRERYPEFTAHPTLGVVLADPTRQQTLILRALLLSLLDRARQLMGAAGGNLLAATREWVALAPDQFPDTTPSDLVQHPPTTPMEWIAALQECARSLSNSLRERMGPEFSNQLFERAYNQCVQRFRRLDSFSIVLSAMPEDVLDEDKIGLLSSSQIRGALTERATELEATNQELEQANQELWLTQRKLIDAREQAEAATRAKGDFLAAMSHEIRTPMNAIIGMTTLLSERPLDDESRDMVETIRSSGDSLLTIINDILDFSKIESGKLDLENEPFDLRRTIEETLEMIAPKVSEAGVQLGYLPSDRMPEWVLGDVTRFRQILLNLLSNAAKFTAEGVITVEIDDVAEHSGPEHPHRVRVCVRDTGIGIPEAARSRLFQSFSQVDASTTRRFGGTGLGLAISRRLAECMDGSIWVESEEGVGSAFWFEIALQRSAEKRAPELPEDSKTLEILGVTADLTTWEFLSNQAAALGLRCRRMKLPLDDQGSRDLLSAGLLVVECRALRAAPPTDLDSLLELVGQRSQPTALWGTHVEAESVGMEATLRLGWPLNRSHLVRAAQEACGIQGQRRSTGELRRITAEQDERLGSLKILLTEDHRINQKVALKLLARLGCTAEIAENGREAVDAALSEEYDVILMDLQMPEMDGLTATGEIRRLCSKQPFIIAMTANAMASDRERCLRAGMDDYVSKPIQVDALTAALRNGLEDRDRRRTGREHA